MKNKKLLYGLCAVLMIFNMLFSTSVWAVPEITEETEQTEEKAEEKPTVDSQGRPILADREAAVLIDGATGNVLYEKDSKKRMYPASTTKIMTALIAVEAINAGEVSLTDNVEITADMLNGLDPYGSSIGLVEGEIMSFDNLLKGLMVASGNDAAMAIAYRLSGSKEAFCQRMNDRAAQLGLEETHFVNPHGLHDENHYTTASDLAKIAREAMKHHDFRNVVDIAHIKMAPTNKTEKERYYINTNGLLSTMRYLDYYYKGTTGIKTGTTDAAGNCLVASALRNGMELISVVLNGEGVKDSHTDSIRLLDYGFENYELIKAVAKDEIVGQADVKWGRSKDTVTLSAVENISVVVPKGADMEKLTIELNLPEKIYAPVKKGDVMCTAAVFYDGNEIGGGEVCADTDIKRSFFWPVMAVGEWLWSLLLIRILVYLILAAAAILVVLLVIGFTREFKLAKKYKRLRKERRRELK